MAKSTMPETIADIDSTWLTHALHDSGQLGATTVRAFDTQILGEGAGFIGQLARITLHYDGDAPHAPTSVIAKFPSAIAQNRGIGIIAGLYETEIQFYRRLAADFPARTPRWYYADFDPEAASSRAVAWALARLPDRVTLALLDRLTALAARGGRRYALLIEDLAGSARVGDQVAGATVEEARAALQALARMHAGMWNSPRLAEPWIRAIDADAVLTHGVCVRTWPRFVDRYRHQVPNVAELGRWLEANGKQLLHYFARTPVTFLHFDYRLDNIFFDLASRPDPSTVTMIDFQAVRAGNPLVDVAYFLRPNLAPEHAAEEEDLLAAYHAELVANGVRDMHWDRCRHDYELAQLWLAMQGAFLLGALDLSHERGVELIDRAVARAAPALGRIDLARVEL
ncbi:MAG: phosphotransferase [Chloroflexi bacterium]|nr:phosphotransferase [Chloroflexota bacterium]